MCSFSRFLISASQEVCPTCSFAPKVSLSVLLLCIFLGGFLLEGLQIVLSYLSKVLVGSVLKRLENSGAKPLFPGIPIFKKKKIL